MTTPQKTPIRKVLVANRGEIACRVIKTCRAMGIRTVAVYSEADKQSLFVKQADEAIFIGPSPSSQSYLNIDNIISVAQKTNSDAIHPGYGFLSENPAFAKACENSSIVFIGPTSDTITQMGSKKEAKILLSKKEPTVPLVPGYNGEDQSVSRLISEAKRIGFPVVIKAAAGGGGKGMRVVREAASLKDSIDSAKTEAKNSFGSDEVILEKYFDSVRHVEIQILGDRYGNVVHCFERECSVQRRHQKVIEESPSVIVTPELRQRMGEAAVKIGKLIKYLSAGTVEFIVDPKTKNFYFLEVNTRLQVEHPVTEYVTGLDLVKAQIQVAMGFRLDEVGLKQDQLSLKGHAIECRLYAEDPLNNFFPCPGKILMWKQSSVPEVRFDSGVETGSEISIFYDPMISKIIAYGENRDIAINKMKKALQESVVLGLQTNKQFLIHILSHPLFVQGNFTTNFIQEQSKELIPEEEEGVDIPYTVAALLWDWNRRNDQRVFLKNLPSGWRNNKYKNPTQFFTNKSGSKKYLLEYEYIEKWKQTTHSFNIKTATEEFAVEILDYQPSHSTLLFSLNGISRRFHIIQQGDAFYIHADEKGEVVVVKFSPLKESSSESKSSGNQFISPMPSKILQVVVQSDSAVKTGELVLVMESMKMENKVYAQKDGKIEIFAKAGDLVQEGKLLFQIQ
eukprot:TRINITY_DN5057_c0_g1_i1.p1 TRINITY_DN5057_c0_g1~~TRINITY_DN5057_c0_g1_i1.p1  ORF type:complete len:678 (-),score=147.02 TRINITY_DN5057_c0_g1_i1:22-2055(-)